MPLRRRVTLGVAALVAASVVAAVLVGWLQGYRIYIVHTGSMVPALRPGFVVVDRPAPASVHRGEIITFRTDSGGDSVVTHRVAAVHGDVIRTKGDANPTIDPWKIHRAQVVGTAAFRVPAAGYVLVYLRQPTGAASVVVISCMVVLLWQLCFGTETAEARDRDSPRGTSGPRRRRAPWPVPEIVRTTFFARHPSPHPVPEARHALTSDAPT